MVDDPIRLVKAINTVEEQIGWYKGQLRRWSAPDQPGYNPRKLTKYSYLASDLQNVLQILFDLRDKERAPYGASYIVDQTAPEPERSEENTLPQPAAIEPAQAEVTPVPVGLPLSGAKEDLSDLPAEVLAELSESFKGQTDPLIQIIDARGGQASIDEILVDLYRVFNEIGKRPIVSNKLYRLARRGLCAPMPGKKGIYTTNPDMLRAAGAVAEEEAEEVEEEQETEGPDVGASGPSSHQTGVSGSTAGPSKPSPVGSSPSTSTSRVRQELLSGTTWPPARSPR